MKKSFFYNKNLWVKIHNFSIHKNIQGGIFFLIKPKILL